MLKTEEEQQLAASLEEMFTPTDALKKMREKSWDCYRTLGLPTRKSENYRYIHLRKLLGRSLTIAEVVPFSEEQLKPLLFSDCERSRIVFVNGAFSADLSDLSGCSEKIVLKPLSEAVRPYGAFLNNRWGQSFKEEDDSFAALNGAFHQEGALLYIPPKTIGEAPIQVVHIIDVDKNHCSVMPRLQIFSGTQSEVKIASSQHFLNGEGVLLNQVIDVVMEDAARLDYSTVATEIPEDTWSFSAFRATLKRDSSLKTQSFTDGSQMYREDYRVALTGENSEALLNGSWLLDGKRQAHANIFIDHQAPNCYSYQLFKGVVDGLARSSFLGKIMVRQAAQQTDAFQLNNNLVLSDRAEVNTKPNLEIFADDVKASHGATVAQLDDEELFYLKTRGCSHESARSLLVKGFVCEVTDKIPVRGLKEIADKHIQTILEV